MQMNTICVLGGSGFVGRALVSRLAADGKTVRVPTRNRERAKELILLPGVEVIETNVHDGDALAGVVASCDAVINLTGILHESGHGPNGRRGFEQVHVDLPRKILAACARHGVRRFVHMSALGADPASRSAYQRSKGMAEDIVREAAQARDLKVTVFRPSVIFGQGDSFLNLFARLAALLPVLPLACPEARFQPVHVGDVANAFADCLGDPRTFGQTFDLCGPKVYRLIELVRYAGQLAGVSTVVVPLSDRLSYLNAWAMEFMPGNPLMTRDDYHAMQVPNICTGNQPPNWMPHDLMILAPVWFANETARGRYNGFRTHARR